MVDVIREDSVAARVMVQRLLAHAADALDEHGDRDEVSSLVETTKARGTGAARQREVFGRSRRLEDVMAYVVEETGRA